MATYGELAVGLSFNPSQDPDVAKIKKLYAEIIDFCNDKRPAASPELAYIYSSAIMHAVTAQMWAVKAITWKG
jgi:hypothetical protein